MKSYKHDKNSGYDNGMGIDGFVMAFENDKNVCGVYEDYPDRLIRFFKTLTRMCNDKGEEKLKSIQIMLREDVLDLYDGYQDNYTT